MVYVLIHHTVLKHSRANHSISSTRKPRWMNIIREPLFLWFLLISCSYALPLPASSLFSLSFLFTSFHVNISSSIGIRSVHCWVCIYPSVLKVYEDISCWNIVSKIQNQSQKVASKCNYQRQQDTYQKDHIFCKTNYRCLCNTSYRLTKSCYYHLNLHVQQCLRIND